MVPVLVPKPGPGTKLVPAINDPVLGQGLGLGHSSALCDKMEHSQSPNDGILKNNCCNIPFQIKHIS